MKSDTHPKYVEATVTCACGSKFTTRSSQAAIRVDICSACHPFYTGRQNIVDTEGRVERFMNKYKKTATAGAQTGKR